MLPLLLVIGGGLLLLGGAVRFLANVSWAGVSGPIYYALSVAEEAYAQLAGSELTVTSLNDGRHMLGSRHYTGNAFDARTRDLQGGSLGPQAQAIANELRRRLVPLGFDVVLEGDHIHVEYDPKPGRSFPGWAA